MDIKNGGCSLLYYHMIQEREWAAIITSIKPVEIPIHSSNKKATYMTSDAIHGRKFDCVSLFALALAIRVALIGLAPMLMKDPTLRHRIFSILATPRGCSLQTQ